MTDKKTERLWLIYFAILFFWALQAYWMIISMYFKGDLFAITIDGHPYVSDFINSYSAGVLCVSNWSQSVNIYDPQVQSALQAKLVAPVVLESPFYNQYPPVMFLIMLPLSLFSMSHAWIAWCLFSLVFMALALRIAVLPNYQKWQEKLIACTAIFATFPMWYSYKLGQTSLFIAPVLIFLFHFLSRGMFFAAGLTSSLVLLKLQYLPLIAAVGTAIGRLKFLGGFSLGTAVLLTGSFLAVGKDNFLAFPRALLEGESGARGSGVAPDMMQNLRGILVLMTGADSRTVHLVAAAAMLVSIALLFFMWWRLAYHKNMQAKKQRFDLLYALTLLAMLFFSLHAHSQDYVMAAIAFETLWRSLRESRTFKSDIFLRRLALFFPILGWPFYVFMFLFQLAKIQPFAAYAFVCAGLCLFIYTRKEKKQTQSEAA